MKFKFKERIFFLSIILLHTNIFSQKIITKLKGKIIDKDCKQIVLYPATENLDKVSYSYDSMTIPVKNNSFEYTLKSDYVQLYYLAYVDDVKSGTLGGNKRFLNDNDVVEFKLYPDISSKNFIKGGRLTNQLQEWNSKYDRSSYIRKMDSLRKNNCLYTNEYQEITKKINKIGHHNKDENMRKIVDSLKQIRWNLSKDKVYTKYGNELIDKMNKVASKFLKEKKKYILTHNDLLSYSLVYDDLKFTNPEMLDNKKDSVLQDKFKQGLRFIKQYPDHPYSTQLNKKFHNLKVGSHYIDFTLPDKDENLISLSSQINGKVAVIDLWGSWCGSCIVKSRELIPVYEKYKDKGFVVVGIAVEYHDKNGFVHALKRDKYPWLNLIDLDGKEGVWEKYGATNYAGAILLVDTNGKIIAVNPKIEEIERILKKLLE